MAGEKFCSDWHKGGGKFIIPSAPPLRAQIDKLPAGDDPHQPLHPRAFASVEKSGGVKTLSRQVYELLADTGLPRPKAHRRPEIPRGPAGPRRFRPIALPDLGVP